MRRRNFCAAAPILNYIEAAYLSEEHTACLLLDLGRSSERYARSVAALCRNYHLCGPCIDVPVPYVHRIVIQLARGSNLLLQVCVLLHRVGDLGMRL